MHDDERDYEEERWQAEHSDEAEERRYLNTVASELGSRLQPIGGISIITAAGLQRIVGELLDMGWSPPKSDEPDQMQEADADRAERLGREAEERRR